MTTLPIHAAHVGTPAFWRSAAASFGARSWRGAMERFAAQHGRAIAHLCDDGALIIERDADGRIRRSTLPPEAVRWSR